MAVEAGRAALRGWAAAHRTAARRRTVLVAALEGSRVGRPGEGSPWAAAAAGASSPAHPC
jgi:hypothetical protein